MENNKHHDDQFRKILEDHPEFDIPKADLDDMRSRLNAADPHQKRRGGFFAWFFPLLLLPVSLGLGYLFYQNQQLTTEVRSLQNQLFTSQTDTIQQKHITYIYDTIYNTIYEERRVQKRVYPQEQSYSNLRFASVLEHFSTPKAFPSSSRSPLNTYSPNQYYNNTNQLFYYHHLASNDGNRNSSFSNASETSNNSLANKIQENKNHYNRLPLPSKSASLEETIDWSKIFSSEELEILFQKKKTSPMYYLRPKGLQLGLSASPFGIADLSGSNAGRLITYGIVGEIEYSKHFRLGIGLQATRYTNEISDPTTVVDFPASAPDNPGDVIREFYISLQQIRIPITFKYLFYNNKKFTPFISLGFAASRSTKQSFRTEFISNTFEEYSKTQDFTDGTFSVKNFSGALGLEYDLNANWSASAATYYYHDLELDPGDYFMLRNIGLRLSLKRKW